MINAMKKINQYVLLGLTGLAYWFSRLYYAFSIAGAAAVMMGMSYTTFLVTMSVMMVVFSAFIAKLLVYVTYRIVGSVFTKKSGMLYPFPLLYGEYTGVVLSFSFLCLLLCGLIELPVLFYPTLSKILGAVSTFAMWLFLFIGAKYILDKYSHDYDRKALAVALSVVPFFMVGITTFITILGVVL